PDLRVTGIVAAPAAWESGSAVSVAWTNFNAGVGPTSGSFYDQIIVSNKTTGSILARDYVYFDATRFGAIEPNTSATGEFQFELPHGPAGAGELVVTITTDFYDNVIESNGSNSAESNNSFAATRNSALRT